MHYRPRHEDTNDRGREKGFRDHEIVIDERLREFPESDSLESLIQAIIQTRPCFCVIAAACSGRSAANRVAEFRTSLFVKSGRPDAPSPQFNTCINQSAKCPNSIIALQPSPPACISDRTIRLTSIALSFILSPASPWTLSKALDKSTFRASSVPSILTPLAVTRPIFEPVRIWTSSMPIPKESSCDARRGWSQAPGQITRERQPAA